jgi:hypothetical protein
MNSLEFTVTKATTKAIMYTTDITLNTDSSNSINSLLGLLSKTEIRDNL